VLGTRATPARHFFADGRIEQGCQSPNMHNGRICKSYLSQVIGRVRYMEESEMDMLFDLLNMRAGRDAV
jgi:hypothetical protein